MEQIMRDSCAGFVNSLKGVSSRRPRQELPGLRRHYWRAERLCSGPYFAKAAGGVPVRELRH
jgi:putative transposase